MDHIGIRLLETEYVGDKYHNDSLYSEYIEMAIKVDEMMVLYLRECKKCARRDTSEMGERN